MYFLYFPNKIEDDFWTRASSVILDGITLAKAKVEEANSIATKSTREYEVAARTPAMLIKKRK